MIPKIASQNLYNNNPLSFKGHAPVSYVVLNGHTETDSKLVDDVTKQFVKQIREGKAEDAHLRQALQTATGDSSLAQAYQRVKMIGKSLITGQDAAELEKIWSKKAAFAQKKQEASNLLKKVFNNKATQKIAIVAEKIDIKGKVKYIVKNLYTTLY